MKVIQRVDDLATNRKQPGITMGYPFFLMETRNTNHRQRQIYNC